MCGIAGFIATTESPSIETGRMLLRKIVQSQYRRGPDNSTIEEVGGDNITVILGHNRLAIIDLTSKSNQPIWDHEHNIVLVFNGEIYNYRELTDALKRLGHVFNTKGDSEVLLEAYKEWGMNMLSQLNGMFAFALYDTNANKIFIVRDRFGVKPLLYKFTRTEFVFASSGQEIARHYGLTPNLRYIDRGLRYGIYDGQNDTPYDGISIVKPGHYLEISVGIHKDMCLNEYKYYDLEEHVETLIDKILYEPLPTVLDYINDIFQDSVNIRLRADVAAAVSLSGGLDSSSIAATAQLMSKTAITGYTLGSPNNSDSEGPLVAQLCQYTGLNCNYIDHDSCDLVSSFQDTLKAQEAPFTSLGIVGQNMVYGKVKKDGVRVLLGGQGGDEIFMGYRKYNVFYLQLLAAQKKYGAALPFIVGLIPMLFSELWQLPVYLKAMRHYRKSATYESAVKLPRCENINLGYENNQPIWKRSVKDVLSTSIPSLLRYEDRNSMWHSVESRMPFMDYRLVEAAIALPVSLKLRNGYGKWLMRQVVKGKIPESIRCARYKRGFDVQHNLWIDKGIGRAIRDQLGEKGSSVGEWLVKGVNINKLYSDEELKRRDLAFAEAVSLIWLSNNLN